MKIVINTSNTDIYNAFSKLTKGTDLSFINAKVESVLFDIIEKNNVDAYILSNNEIYFKKAVSYIKKTNPYTPVVAFMPTGEFVSNILVDTFIDTSILYKPASIDILAVITLHNITNYIRTFATLQKLTAKIREKIEFSNCTYDPTKRILYHNGKEIKKMSIKEGGMVEILSINYKEIVKKEVILEKVWRKSDYFASRSMDVYITNLRNTFKKNNINLTIKNISGVGLILE